MKRLRMSFRNYLSNIGKIGELPLGTSKPEETDDTIFRSELKNIGKSNNLYNISAYIFLLVMFLVGIVLLFYCRNNLIVIVSLFSTFFLIVLYIIKTLHQFWLEKFIIDQSLVVLQHLSPQEAANYLLCFYNSFLIDQKDKK